MSQTSVILAPGNSVPSSAFYMCAHVYIPIHIHIPKISKLKEKQHHHHHQKPKKTTTGVFNLAVLNVDWLWLLAWILSLRFMGIP